MNKESNLIKLQFRNIFLCLEMVSIFEFLLIGTKVHKMVFLDKQKRT